MSESSLRAVAEVSLLEGPAAADPTTVVFSDVVGDRLLSLTDGRIEVLAAPSGRTNGNVFDHTGRLISCEGAEHGPGGGRRIVRRRTPHSEPEVLAERYDGSRLNSPNDATVDDIGRIYFSDPRYGARDDLELNHESVYRIDPDGALERVVTQPAIERPNGVAVRPDGRELYVVDSNYDSPGGARRIWAFELDDLGKPSDQRLVIDFSPGRGGDGLEVDAAGSLYVCAGIQNPRSTNETDAVRSGVYVMKPDGSMIDVIAVETDVITNCCFGGRDMRDLYVTAGHRLYAGRSGVPGWHAWRWEA